MQQIIIIFSNTMQFINAGLGTTVAILVGIDSCKSFSEIYNRHKNTSLEYSKLCAKIIQIDSKLDTLIDLVIIYTPELDNIKQKISSLIILKKNIFII